MDARRAPLLASGRQPTGSGPGHRSISIPFSWDTLVTDSPTAVIDETDDIDQFVLIADDFGGTDRHPGEFSGGQNQRQQTKRFHALGLLKTEIGTID
jgi:hypothetical protein